VAERYLGARKPRPPLEIWSFQRQPRRIAPGGRVRFQIEAPFTLHFSRDGWTTVEELRSTPTPCGFEFADVTLARGQRAPLQFTFRYADGRWQGQDFAVAVAGP
jgi:glucoamylase